MKHSNIKKYYKQINEFLFSLKDQKNINKYNRNYCYFFTSENNENLSICAEFVDIDRYYGIKPTLNIRSIIQDIKDKCYDDENKFYEKVNEYVNKYWQDDSLDSFTYEQRKALMARSLINIYEKFEKDSNGEPKLIKNVDALYNGVNNRLVEVNSDYFEVSGKTNYIKFKLQRTTFFTTLAFSHNKHKLLDKYKEILDEIDTKENECFNELKNSLSNTPNQKESIKYLNTYLNSSKHTHYINVSANITSKENDLVYCLRGVSEDKNTLYCSANGVSEVYDENVDYYMFSVNDDVPTIHTNPSINRIDFSNEINREIRAELNIENMTNIYDFYGFTIMAKTKDVESNGLELLDACHFNILSSTHCYETFDEICKHQKQAVEVSEARKVFGWKIKKFNNLYDFLEHYITEIGKFILDYDKLFFALYVLILHNSDSFKGKFDSNYDVIIYIISMFVLVFSLLKFIYEKTKKLSKIHTTVIFGKNKNAFNKYKDSYHNRITKFKYINDAHYIYEIMALCYYLDVNEENEQ